MKFWFVLVIAFASSAAHADIPVSATPAPDTREGAPFLNAFPQLREYVHEEPKSGFYLGLGASPVGTVKDRLMFSLDFFQLHWISTHWDWALLNATYAVTQGQSSTVQSNHFIFRTTPKYRLGRILSFGPLVGYEFVSFPNVDSRLVKDNYHTPTEPFSSRGAIYGLELCETFEATKDYLFKITQTAFRQSYSTSKTPEKWDYTYTDSSVAANTASIEANTVITVGFSFLY